MFDDDHQPPEQQQYAAVQFEQANHEQVMMPVCDLAELADEARKQHLIDSAWTFYQRVQFARDATDPEFVKTLARSISKHFPLTDMLARLLVYHIGLRYLERLEKEASEKGEKIVDANALHLRLERTGSESITIVIEPPEDWEDRAIARCSDVAKSFFDDTTPKGLKSCEEFAEWIWINQLARSLEDLEQSVGATVLEELSDDEFDRSLFERTLDAENFAPQFLDLTLHYLDRLAEITVEEISAATKDLWTLEVLLAFRDHPPEHIQVEAFRSKTQLVTVDFGALLPSITKNPDDLYQLSPRRFEELVAHIFEQFGYRVELTPHTKDGGFDVSAIRRAEVDVRFLVQCKRYTPPHKVGRPAVQQMFGVLLDRNIEATKAIVATTSTFTSDAQAFIENNRWKLEGRDRAGILDWITLIRTRPSGLWLPTGIEEDG